MSYLRGATTCALAVALCLLAACDVPKIANKETQTAPKKEPSKSESKGLGAVQRFVPISSNATLVYGVPSPFLALDTVTGNLCRTWDYSWPNPNANQKDVQELFTCDDLYTYYPEEKPKQ